MHLFIFICLLSCTSGGGGATNDVPNASAQTRRKRSVRLELINANRSHIIRDAPKPSALAPFCIQSRV